MTKLIPGKLYVSNGGVSLFVGEHLLKRIHRYSSGEVFLFVEIRPGNGPDGDPSYIHVVFLDKNGNLASDGLNRRTLEVYSERFRPLVFKNGKEKK